VVAHLNQVAEAGTTNFLFCAQLVVSAGILRSNGVPSTAIH
jgi:hypothetical protein